MEPRRPRELAPTAPELFVPDVEAAVRFYTEKLGFDLLRSERVVISGREQAVFAEVALEDSLVLLAHESLYSLMGGGPVGASRGLALDIRIMVADVDALYRRARDNNAAIVHDIADRYYGLRDFIVRDLNGFRLRFASALR